MQLELLIGLVTFSFVSTITPGPNNLMLMSSGANFGFKRSLPHMLGIGIGFSIMVMLVGVGLVQVFEWFPQSYSVLRVLSIGYLLYLAFKVATAGAPKSQASDAKPLMFMQAAAFQWVNPKGWSMALSAISVYAPSATISSIVLVSLVFAMANMPSTSMWTLLGLQIQNYLTSNKRLRIFNGLMGGLLVASVIPVMMGT